MPAPGDRRSDLASLAAARRPNDANRLNELEAENARLKKLVANRALDIEMIKGISADAPVDVEFGVVAAQRLEDFSVEVALLAADAFGHRHALGGAAVRVGPAARVVTQPDDRSDVERAVAGPITATVQTVSVGFAR